MNEDLVVILISKRTEKDHHQFEKLEKPHETSLLERTDSEKFYCRDRLAIHRYTPTNEETLVRCKI